MQDQCEIVLGNHDLHFLAIYFGGHQSGPNDTFDELLAAEDVASLAHWLRSQRLLHYDESFNVAMVHAGIPHLWNLSQARALAKEVEAVIAGCDARISYVEFFEKMYGNEPRVWQDELTGLPRLRLITNYLTRMRLIDKSGTLEFQYKGPLSEAPADFNAWFDHVDGSDNAVQILFGHWAALDGVTGQPNIVALDTGCVWGRHLTAVNVATGELHAVAARAR